MTGSNRISHFSHLQSAAAGSAEHAQEAVASLGRASLDRGKALARRSGRVMSAHPGLTLAAAFSVGVFLGWLIKRR